MSVGDGIGKRIQQAREARGISKSQLAREAGVTVTAVWNWELNQIAPRAQTLAKVASSLGVSEDYLRTGRGENGSAVAQEPKPVSVSDLIDETRRKVARITGFPIERVKLSLELLAE